MSTITDIQVARFKEAENKRHMADMRKVKAENAGEFRKEITHNEKQIERLRQEYEVKLNSVENDLEKQLSDVRRKHTKRVEEENHRLDEELKNLKLAHQEQVSEIKISNMSEIDRMRESQERTLANAKEKFLKEQSKYEV